MTLQLTIIGVGGLGRALAAGTVDNIAGGAADIALTLCARRPGCLDAFAGSARVVYDVEAAVVGADVVVLAVKPKDTVAVLRQLQPTLSPTTLVVSCAAGVSLSRLTAMSAVARAMPNLGALRGVSTTAICLGPTDDQARDRARLHLVFGAVGTVKEVLDEQQLHAITAVAASGPAWLLMAVEALVDGAVEQGVARADALVWARGALLAASARLDDGVEPLSVRAQVTSPGGTTAAGLAILEQAGLRSAIQRAVAAAVDRSRALQG